MNQKKSLSLNKGRMEYLRVGEKVDYTIFDFSDGLVFIDSLNVDPVTPDNALEAILKQVGNQKFEERKPGVW